MSEGSTDAPSGAVESPADAPPTSPPTSPPLSSDVQDLLAVADQVLLEREQAPEKAEDEEALEWHEVIELQAFSERKAWIEEKTKLLEQMPAIEVFVGMHAVRESATEVPGLPTREQLRQWLVEHDKIEKETEIFDSGELKKLKRFTKAAAQRNLSPADTDLIEITLTTIYALDKLLHLLRDRSDSLDLLGIRLSWEERRVAAWNEYHNILNDLKDFLKDRARWSPAVYDQLEEVEELREASPGEHVLKRRGSTVSIQSETSRASIPGYSRGARYKLMEALSREAALFASRISSLRHSKIIPTGKAIDKLIDTSRKPVPDEMLDEQDKLENDGVAAMEPVSKFAMQIVMQWKKADEFYVETLKDKSDAQNLLEEIEVAKLGHPTARQDASFMSRAGVLSKRLLLRGNPISSPLFPKPDDPHFPDQATHTSTVIQQLSSELSAAQQQVKKVELCAKEYRASLEAVKQVEGLCNAASDLVDKYASIVDRLENGVKTTSGDGLTPDISSEACLDSSRHSTFLSLFPSIVQELEQADKDTTPLLSRARVALLHLGFPGIDAQFKVDSQATIDALETSQTQAAKAKNVVSVHISTLAQVRKIWSSMGALFQETEGVKSEILDAMSRQMWRQQVRHEAPPTPESPTSMLPSVFTSPPEVLEHISQLRRRAKEEVSVPLASISPSLQPSLRDYLIHSSSALEGCLTSTSETARFWEAVQKQATMMGAVRDEVHMFQMRIEDLKLSYDKAIQSVSDGTLPDSDIPQTEEGLAGDLSSTRADVQAFLDQLPSRVPFVDEVKFIANDLRSPRKRQPSLGGGLNLSVIQQAAQPSLPFDPAALDKGVRTDSNTYSMMLSGAIKTLEVKAEQFQLAKKAHSVDIALGPLTTALNDAGDAVSAVGASLNTSEERLSTQRLTELSSALEETAKAHEDIIEQAFSPVRASLQILRATTSPSDASMQAVVSARQRAVEHAETQAVSWKKTVATLKQQLLDAQKAELLRLAEETRLREEQERLEAEAAALKTREAAAAAEAERLAQLERERVKREVAELEERRRRDKERAEAEERERQERFARMKREAEERGRREAEEAAERARQEQAEAEERAKRFQQEAEERARREQEAAERRAREEEERLEQERLEKERLKMERIKNEQMEAEERERLARERAEAEGRERLALEKKEVEERQRLARENAEAEERARLAREKAEEAERTRVTREKALVEEREILELKRLEREKQEQELQGKERRKRQEAEEREQREPDVFGVRQPSTGLSPEMSELGSRIFAFRKRLRSMGINEMARPSSRSNAELPSESTCKSMGKAFSVLRKEVAFLPASLPDEPVVDAELRSLREEINLSKESLARINNLADFAALLKDCDDALSDLLEHIDSYPSPPIGSLSTSFTANVSQAPEEQLSSRLSFTRDFLSRMKTLARALKDDPRIPEEHERILQTWTELEAMALDLINGNKSRPASVISSGRSSRNSAIHSTPMSSSHSHTHFSKLSASPGKFLTPPSPVPNARRTASGPSAGTSTPRSSSRLSIASSTAASSSRSVSGPMSGVSLWGSTYSSRQRTTSVTSSASSLQSPISLKRALPIVPPSRPRTQSNAHAGSPVVSDAPHSRSSLNLPRPPSSHSSWGRAPRMSFGSASTRSPPTRTPAAKPARKPYVANPKNKLDVAVGDVMNKLPVDIKIELVADTWKDQSGKYWIGDADPKLCFCRILRSQTVMVRVGGGWQELSRFIRDHFADSFRLLPELSPPHIGQREERWISSSTLAQAVDNRGSSMSPPKTPEPKMPFLPSFALVTPSGTSPKTIKTPPSSGSPLTALQFMRRADMENASYRPETPTRSTRSGTSSVMSTPSRHHPHPAPAWRP
ncbi:uncharacterized protein BXZ73DRAFT_40145 [Epithele typhae]|uniref:uncharacterized protein n=1 Tax=Epithele typhae TaxID=378194 RepID=UPI00200791A0|nr:uncharacterized protein BXZ73DRAFT_40145 [Epithele typhae]KAH9943020.1 hypothetical protein BXZ73DRAFT_40145 [Epithele typhae]